MIPGTPVQLSEASEKRLREYIARELDEAMPEHIELEQELDNYQKIYDAEPATKK